MLLELRVRKFAIIDDIHLSFGRGLNIFTGETGAGKSIIIDAVKLILGDRAAVDLIRSTEDEAIVEAIFDISSEEGIQDILDGAGIAANDLLLMKRIVSRTGRNRIFINDAMSTVITLRSLGERLVDIYGQSEHQSLTREDVHIDILDTFLSLGNTRKDMLESFEMLKGLKARLGNLVSRQADIKEQKEFLIYQQNEIEAADLKEGEEEGLKKEKERLNNAEQLFSTVSEADNILYSADGSILEMLWRTIKKLKAVSRYDERLISSIEMMETGSHQIDEAASFLRDYAGSISFDRERLDEINARLDFIMRLKKKYGSTVEEVLKRRDEIKKSIDELESLDERISHLKKAIDEAKRRVVEIAAVLTKKRKDGALRLKVEVEKELESLGMEGTIFNLKIESEFESSGEPKVGEKGMDKVSFLISPNPGEEPKPLSRIASGGELSRIMLALKKVVSNKRVSTIIFDEVDSGVGGRVADIVGRKISEVSRGTQVICITHLPQIAKYADIHYSVRKDRVKGRTFVRADELKGDGVVKELARMLGDSAVTEKTMEHARELFSRKMRGREGGY